MKYYDVEQNSPEWFSLRLGKFTASTFKDLFLKETTQTYQDAIYKVVFEILTKESPESFTNEWMQRGSELEGEARAWYEFDKDLKVSNGGFFELNEWIGASPDGLIGEDGLIEIKCPKYSTMINYLIDKKLPETYKWQVQGQLWVSERDWTDFIAYHPKLPRFILRVKRDEKLIKELKEKTDIAIEKVQQTLEKLR